MSDTPGGPDWFKAQDGKWYPPSGSGGSPQFSNKKEKGGCLKKVLIAVGVLFLLGIIAAVAGGGSDQSSDSTTETTTAAAASCVGKTYPDQQKNDVCADAAGTVVFEDMTVTATPFKSKEVFSSDYLCSTITIKNTSNESQDYNVFDFKVQTPGGVVATTSSIGAAGDLDSGALIAGATKTGDMCTEDKGEKGQYVVIYKPNPFDDARGTWLFTA